MDVIVGVVSDTHLRDDPDCQAFLGRLARDHFSDAQAIIHAGDMIDSALLTAFSPLPVYGVRGNMDAAHPDLPYKRILELAGFRIGLIHGWGSAFGLEERLLQEFADARLDCLVYGHSHYPLNEQRGALLLFNPGSPTDPRQAPFPTVGRLYLGQTIRGEIVRCG
ncbi:metallophosphoesterase family protein [Geoalkalibacter halelectricus]|uniref:Phosphoesterase n=1 Tax=Geoalkalibacter halelectricus TaxID=2847045 RepID=A0ABY5ZLH8_9BACT|nr:metallophosphoesterase family protein [Geoalkalibacter halelectricus]MDO3379595.1 metallophosphatase family protein [Geoalkalibacter halelectricus]UWZ78589.1 metallophosphatase family protein [Geoalkalibacter halelectricus]